MPVFCRIQNLHFGIFGVSKIKRFGCGVIERAAIQTQFENKKQRSGLKDKIRDKINKNDQQLRGYEDEARVKGKVRK